MSLPGLYLKINRVVHPITSMRSFHVSYRARRSFTTPICLEFRLPDSCFVYQDIASHISDQSNERARVARDFTLSHAFLLRLNTSATGLGYQSWRLWLAAAGLIVWYHTSWIHGGGTKSIVPFILRTKTVLDQRALNMHTGRYSLSWISVRNT